MRLWWSALVALVAVAAITGCGPVTEPYRASRQVLGTAVTVTTYHARPELAKLPVDGAFSAMGAVEKALSPYAASSSISTFNRSPYTRHPLPPDASRIIGAIRSLGAEREFSPALFGVTRLYGFGATESVPATDALAAAVAAAATLEVTAADGGLAARFVPTPSAKRASGEPGFDFGGASKGLALDDAMRVIILSGLIRTGGAALITAGSSTLADGVKPDGEPWRIGIEDPREPGRVIATVEATGTLSVSTSGDYQVHFERGGVRYHHILDPLTGRPARGLRSLTVFGRMSGVAADILSTALFVMGPDDALAYARERDIGVAAVDDRGRLRTYVPPLLSGVTLAKQAEPVP